jgi:hypothetical protein
MNAYMTFLCVAAAASLSLGCGPAKGKKAKEPQLDEPVLTDDPPPERNLEGQAGLIITASPNIEIKVDGKSVGTTPLTHEGLDSGEHEVTFMFEGDDQVTLTVNLDIGEFQKVHQSVSPNASDAQMGK